MKHELFRAFTVNKKTLSSDVNVQTFLNSKISPKSISLSKLIDNDRLLVIGYEEAETPHFYYIVQKKLNDTIEGATLENLEEHLNRLAADLDGVICQDVHVGENKVTVTFLLAKEVIQVPC